MPVGYQLPRVLLSDMPEMRDGGFIRPAIVDQPSHRSKPRQSVRSLTARIL